MRRSKKFLREIDERIHHLAFYLSEMKTPIDYGWAKQAIRAVVEFANTSPARGERKA